jgi:hypothetical protein
MQDPDRGPAHDDLHVRTEPLIFLCSGHAHGLDLVTRQCPGDQSSLNTLPNTIFMEVAATKLIERTRTSQR